VVGAGFAVVATAFWILWDATATNQGKAFTETPQFLLWLLILCALSAVMVLALWPIGAILRDHGSELGAQSTSSRSWLSLTAGLIVIAGLMIMASAPVLNRLPWASSIAADVPKGEEWPLPHHDVKMMVFLGVGFVVALSAILGIWLVGLALAHLSQQEGVSARADRFLRLRGELNLLVGIAGAILGLSTFGLAALRNAVVAAVPRLEYGVEYVLVYGLWFTGVLAIASAPTYAALRVAGAELRDATFPLPEASDLLATLEKRDSLEARMGLNLTASGLFKGAAAVASPLIGSLVGLLIPD
jgi:hypothetical protein